MKKIFSLSEIFIVIAITISIYCFSLVISLSYQDYLLAKEANNFNENLRVAQFNYEEDKIFSDKINELEDMGIKNIMTSPITSQTIKEDSISANNVRGVVGDYIFKYVKNTEDIELLKKTFNDKDNVAIIGKGAEKYCKTVNDEKYISVFNNNYKVISIIVDNSFLKSSIFIPMKQLPFYNNKYNNFLFIFLNNDLQILKNDKSLSQIKNVPKQDMIKAITESPKLKGNLLNLLIGILNLMLFSLFYCEKIKKRLSIMRILGGSNFYIFKEVGMSYLKLSIISLIIGIGLSNFTYYFSNNFFYGRMSPINYVNIALCIVMMFFIIILITLFVLMNVIKFNIMKEIR